VIGARTPLSAKFLKQQKARPDGGCCGKNEMGDKEKKGEIVTDRRRKKKGKGRKWGGRGKGTKCGRGPSKKSTL